MKCRICFQNPAKWLLRQKDREIEVCEFCAEDFPEEDLTPLESPSNKRMERHHKFPEVKLVACNKEHRMKAILLLLPEPWIPLIDRARQSEPRNLWIREAIRDALKLAGTWPPFADKRETERVE